MLLVWWLAITPARGGTRVLLAAEAITVTLIVIVIVFGELAGHSAPNGLGLDWSVFKLPSGTPLSTVFLGVVFGFLSFAGFFGGIYFFVVTAVEVMGFGTVTLAALSRAMHAMGAMQGMRATAAMRAVGALGSPGLRPGPVRSRVAAPRALANSRAPAPA